jgi:TrwC relaxase
MRFTVTALGSAGDKPVGVVVGQIARYLIAPGQPAAPGASGPAGGAPSRPGRPGEESVSRYYADRGDTPGRWLGVGAGELGLAGEVDFDEFTSVLAGRHPHTGERLITARGSAGRVRSLGTGTAARFIRQGEALYAVRDAAKLLGWSQVDVRVAMTDGERWAAARLLDALTGTAASSRGLRTETTQSPTPRDRDDPGHDRDEASGPDTRPGRWGPHRATIGTATARPAAAPDPGHDRDDSRPVPESAGDGRDGPGLALVPFVDRDGTRYVSERELSRLQGLLDREVTAEDVLASGDPGDELPIPAAARVVGASPSYLARLCRTYENHRAEITTAAGRRRDPEAGVRGVPAHPGGQLSGHPRLAGRVRRAAAPPRGAGRL